jgi:hypothetical protein
MKNINRENLINSIKCKSSKIFSNSNKDIYHTLLTLIFTYSEKEINILVSNFSSIDKLFNNDDFILINNFIKTKKLNILYFKNFNDSMFSKNINLLSKNLTITKLQSPIFDKDQLIQEFITWDNHGYRFSPNAKKLIGIVSANDEEFTSLCNKVIKSRIKFN